jgi:hypothetical protein
MVVVVVVYKRIFHTGIEKALMVEKESHQFGK